NFEKVPDVYNYYGELLLDQQKFQEAIEKFETAVQMEQKERVTGMNVLPLINKALALFQWKQDFSAAQELCEKALIIDPECDIAVATMAQLLLQQGKVPEALEYFEKAAELSRTEPEIVNALSYAEATRTQLEVQEKYPQLASRLQESTLGILAAVKYADASKVPQPWVTEILFYAARKNVQQDILSPSNNEASSADPEWGLHALPLSSDLLLFNDTDITPPTSPVLGTPDPNIIDGRFIPRPWDEPTLRQRRKIALDSTFSAATDRRKRHSGASVAAAAAAQHSPSLLPTLPRLKSEASRGSVPLLTRPKSRSPSIASLRRDTTIPETKQRIASGLSRATPAPVSSPQPSTEQEILQQKNKDMVSKVVLAGLRVWGFTASKRKKRASTSAATTETQQIAVDPEEEAKDEEYKLLYHHVYKAACFAFRAWIGKEDLSGKEYAEKVRDTVDALLEILCKDPMEQTRGEEMDLGEGLKGAVVRTPKGELGEEEKGLR
ncbi:hypothetical protein KCU77_g14758, partial [Aureobasidium melanogenum]